MGKNFMATMNEGQCENKHTGNRKVNEETQGAR